MGGGVGEEEPVEKVGRETEEVREKEAREPGEEESRVVVDLAGDGEDSG